MTAPSEPIILRNYGGSAQLRVDSAADLRGILDLPDAHWTATSAPVSQFHCDTLFLKYLDSDENNRIRTDELRAALRWTFDALKDLTPLDERTDLLSLESLNESAETGLRVKGAAEVVLKNLNLVEAQSLTLAQVRDRKHIMAQAASNGDGVLPPDAAQSESTAAFIQTVVDCLGGEKDLSGRPGITAAMLDMFLEEASAALTWRKQGEMGNDGNPVQPWGAETGPAYQALAAVRAKVNEFFTQCDLLRVEPEAAQAFRLSTDKLSTLASEGPDAMAQAVIEAPLAEPNSEGLLDLNAALNPAWSRQILALRERVLKRALGEVPATLSREKWSQVCGLFEPHRAWVENPTGQHVAKLDTETLRGLIDGPEPDNVRALVEADRAVARELEQVGDVEKLILYQMHLIEFSNSFVNFSRLYDPTRRSLFEVGTLVIDGREMTFCVHVDDRAAHRKIAEHGHMCVLYVEVRDERDGGERFEVVTAVSSGESATLWVGKRGVFFDVNGREYDAVIRDMIENPVSLREIIRAPFQRIGAFIGKQIEKFGQAQQVRVEQAVATPAGNTATRDLVLAGSLGMAALGSALAFITRTLDEVGFLKVLLVLLGIVLLLVGPGMIMGYLRLRQRDLTALLEASGWAINLRMRLTMTLGRLFTRKPPHPEGAKHERRDLVPGFLEKAQRRPVRWRLVLLVALSGVAVVCLVMLWTLVKLLILA